MRAGPAALRPPDAPDTATDYNPPFGDTVENPMQQQDSQVRAEAGDRVQDRRAR